MDGRARHLYRFASSSISQSIKSNECKGTHARAQAPANQEPRKRWSWSEMYRSRCCARLTELSARSASASRLCGDADGTDRCGCEATAVAPLLPPPHPREWAPAAARYSSACATRAHEVLKEVMPNGSGE
eukprot:scaffold544_cov117-Isochrysis_galbana.AAC.31